MERKKAIKIVGMATGSALLLLVAGVVGIPKLINLLNAPKNETNTDTKPNTGTTTQNTNPIGSTSDVKKFQDWMDANHANWLNDGSSLNKDTSKGYGNYGSQTTKAWTSYGSAYKSSTGTATKSFKVYSKISLNPIKTNVNDLFSLKYAAKDEYLGMLTGISVKDFLGTNYLQITMPDDNSTKYILYNSTYYVTV
jgi:hypothetical protein